MKYRASTMVAQFRLSDEKKINSADGTTNTAITNIYFPFFGAPYHLILHGKISGLRNVLEIWGSISVLGLFWFRRKFDKPVMVKLHGKKN